MTSHPKLDHIVAKRGGVNKLLVSPAGQEALLNYKYVSGPSTPLDKFLNKLWWTPAVEFLPIWLAPNAVTVIGLAAMLVSCLLLVGQMPNFTEEAPAYAYIAGALGMFIYQTMDAIDGKQARRTGSSSPLGQICDHGCDTFAATTGALFCALLFQYGYRAAVLSLSVLHTTFFCCQWEELYTGILRSGVGLFGVTEAQLTIMGLLVWSGVLGPGIWQTSLFGWEFRLVASAGCTLSNVCIATTCAVSTVSCKMKSIVDLMPVGLTILTAYYSQVVVPTGFLAPLRIISLGNLFSYLSCRMILCAVTHMNFPIVPAITTILPVLACFVAEANDLLTPLPQSVDIAIFLYVTFMFLSFVVRAAEEICALLDLKVFSISNKQS